VYGSICHLEMYYILILFRTNGIKQLLGFSFVWSPFEIVSFNLVTLPSIQDGNHGCLLVKKVQKVVEVSPLKNLRLLLPSLIDA